MHRSRIDAVYPEGVSFRAWTKLIFSEHCDQEGGSYSWDGKRVGAGKLTHVDFEIPRRIEQKIVLIQPFK